MNINGAEFLSEYPKLKQTLLNSKFLDIIPGGFSIATDVSCKNIIHNPIAAKFLRIEPWGKLSYSSPEPPPLKAYQFGRPLEPKDLPTQRAAWYGEEVSGLEVEFVWDDGVSKIARFSSSPLKDENGNICGAITTMEDITDLVNMTRELNCYKTHLEDLVEERNAKLRLSEERFAKVFRSSPHMAAIIRKSNFRFIDVNESFLHIAGCSREEAIGKTPVELGLPEKEFQELREIMDKRGSMENIEITIPMAKSGHVTLLVGGEQIELNGEECILVASNDITEIKRMQVEMVRLEGLNLVGQMAASIGHEVRNPMTTIRGYLQLLGARPEFNSHNSTFNTMIEELDRANSIITGFLSLARNKPVERQRQNINNIIQRLYPLLEADAYNQNKRIKFQAEQTPDIYLNANEITQLVLNLCRNGLEAMKDQKMITIHTYSEGKYVVLSIHDEGSGIPLEYLSKLGTPFFTTKESGTGLGLATCYSIVNRHSGKIDVESNQNGTRVYVRFPINLMQ